VKSPEGHASRFESNLLQMRFVNATEGECFDPAVGMGKRGSITNLVHGPYPEAITAMLVKEHGRSPVRCNRMMTPAEPARL
jgi:hypothetical protein